MWLFCHNASSHVRHQCRRRKIDEYVSAEMLSFCALVRESNLLLSWFCLCVPTASVATRMFTPSEIKLPNTAAPVGSSILRIARVNPLEYEAELKSFMTANGLTAFDDFFDRGYGAVVEDGGASWVAFDDVGRMQLCLTEFVHRFQFRGAQVLGGMTGNLMAAPASRTFFPALALYRRMLSETQHRGELDFMYGDPMPQAYAISRAAKMDHIGNLDRLVLPVADRSLLKNVGARVFASAASMLGGRVTADVRSYAAASGCLEDFDSALGPAGRMLPRHSVSMLRRRLYGFPGPNDFVVELHLDRSATEWDALVLLRFATETRVLSILSVRRRVDVALRYVIPALVRVARRAGAYRLQIETILESKMASEFRSLGFRPRGDILPILVKSFSPVGEAAVRNVAEWEVTTLDMERLS